MSVQALHQGILAALDGIQVAGDVSLELKAPSGITKVHPYYELYETVFDGLTNFSRENRDNIVYVLTQAISSSKGEDSPPLIEVLTVIHGIVTHLKETGKLLTSPNRKQHLQNRVSHSPRNPSVSRQLFSDIKDTIS